LQLLSLNLQMLSLDLLHSVRDVHQLRDSAFNDIDLAVTYALASRQ
jgi:hypothetical protein